MSQVNHHQSGIGYWRSLEQLADTPEVQDLLSKEFPGYDPASMAAGGAPSRRRFLKLMGASMALAGLSLTGCRRWPEEKLVPYSTNPAGRVPGATEQYATNWEFGGVAQALLVNSFDGRPIKIEGNPSHPASWIIKDKYGSADAWAQASILEMYDPDRSRAVRDRSKVNRSEAEGADGPTGTPSTWDAFNAFASEHFSKLKGTGTGFAILSEATASPSVAAMRKRVQAAFPQAKWYEYEPLTRDAELEGSRAAFGKAVRSVYNLDKADVVLSLDADLLGFHPNHVRQAADWSERRRGAEKGEMNRVYVAETCFSITGAVADERIAVDPSRIPAILSAIAGKLGVAGAASLTIVLGKKELEFVEQASADLKAASGRAVVAVGPAVAPPVHALAHAINAQLGAVGKTVTLIDDPAGDRPTHMAAIAELAKAIKDKAVNTLLILGGNPAYDAPADLDFADAIKNVSVSIHLSVYDDETSQLCKWHLPRAHYLEAWGDARAWDGTAGVTQPLIEPLFGGKSPVELLALVAGEDVTAGEQIVRRTWKEQFIKTGDFETAWRRVLHAGFLEGTASPASSATAKNQAPDLAAASAAPKAGTFFLKFEPDPHTYDGRFANNGWLQETHAPLTKLIWDNAAMVSVKDARDVLGGLKNGDIIHIEGKDGWMDVAAYVMPGQPVGVISLSLGYGRTAAGHVGTALGFPSYRMRTTGAPYVLPGLKVTKQGGHYTLALTTLHHLIDEVGKEGRDERVGGKGETGKVVREATLAEYKKDPTSPHTGNHGAQRLQLYNPPVDDHFSHPHRWGMTIDMNTCIACNACVVACQAENNIPVVGKDQSLMHREMHWIRIDQYFKGSPDDSEIDVVHQPMLCVHCENAPCEQVCPVAATMHDTEGLNTMVYNRCIGTRYCSNNCPYKVRRFNYFDWHVKPPRKPTGVLYPGLPDGQQQDVDRLRRMQFNPDVTVRMRGVMEKCTYCTQRIQRTKIDKRNRGETIQDLDVITACQQACPTQAIVFGNLKDPNARVTKLQDEKNYPRVYEVLGDLNTRPRTKFLAKIRNPVEAPGTGGGGGHGGEHGGGHAAAAAVGANDTETVG